ncbi:MAG: hypothetical protein JXR68_11500 [Bacteroidales bacterium]|nr:hypothetical protein [Bacteroidales bacterium]
MKIKELFYKYELIIFIGFALINAIPVLLFQFFPSMDGASHLYNANIINDLLFNKNSIYHQFYEFNPRIVPNWGGHIILSVFSFVFKGYIAEKILLAIYFIALPLSFRYLIKSFNPTDNFLSFLIFPFTYHFMFCLGYYNFSLSFIIGFFIIGFIVNNSQNIKDYKYYLKLLGLFLLLYFTHIFGFVFTVLIIACFYIWELIFPVINKQHKKENITYFLQKSIITFILLLPFLILILLHVLSTKSNVATSHNLSEIGIGAFIKSIRPIIVYDFNKEIAYTTKMFYVLFLFAFIIFYERIQEFVKNKRYNKIVNFSDFWLVLTFIMLTVIITFPNFLAGAGNVTNRFGLAFFFVFISWIATNKIVNWLKISGLILILSLQLVLVTYYYSVIKSLNADAKAIYESAEYIKENSTVYPINTSNHWLEPHFLNYLSFDKTIFVHENYEAEMHYFPLIYKQNAIKLKQDLLNYDYIFIFGNDLNKVDDNQKQIIQNNFSVVKTTDKTTIYKKKNYTSSK